MLKVRKIAKSDLNGLISHELQQLRNQNFVSYFDLDITTFSQSLVSDLYMVAKCSKLKK